MADNINKKEKTARVIIDTRVKLMAVMRGRQTSFPDCIRQESAKL